MRAFSAALGTVAALTLLTGAAQDTPKSILPEDVFGPPPAPRVAPAEPVPGTVPPEAPLPAPTAPEGALPLVDAGAEFRPRIPGPAASAANPLDSAAPSLDINVTGVLSPAAGGYGPSTFAGSDGRALMVLMHSMHAPIASRWAHIVLVRALASIVPAPDGVRPADWVAARASLLMRLGESDVAHTLVAQVPVDRFTPRLYGVAFDVALAAADPTAICPIAQTGQTLFARPVWRLGAAMCAAFDGDDVAAAEGFQALRTEGKVDPFDVSLAERLAASAGEGARLGANVDWGEVEQINLYRLGLGVAAGASIPDRLIDRLPLPARGWLFRAAASSDGARAAVAGAAAAQGIVGSAELAAFWSALAADPASAAVAGDTATHLRQAYAGSAGDRMAGMRALWDGAASGGDRYAGLVLTAGPAIALRPNKRFAAYATDLMASALAGGRADVALGWWQVAADEGGDGARRAWGLAVLADGGGRVEVSPGRFADWRKAAGDGSDQRARLLLAALAGLGRAGSDFDGERRALGMTPLADRWTARIDAAAAARRVGEVAVLAGTGLQCGWADAPAAHLKHIVAALVRVGRANEARLIAAEAVTRA
jgi:hypothetical protein